MTRPNCRYTEHKHVAFIWLVSAVLFYTIFLMARRFPSPPPPIDGKALYARRRTVLYSKMAKDLDEHGPAFLKQGETSQSLSLSDIFEVKDGAVKPVLKPADPPVRANVLYLSKEFSVDISEAVKDVFSPHFANMIWFQNSSVYHFSMFHASHHITPVPATEEEIEIETKAIRKVAEASCPMKIVLDRVVLTSTGVLLGCWQVVSGTDPITIRASLRAALPRAPEKQLYDAAILHTSFARILGHPTSPEGLTETSDQLQFFHELVTRLDNQLRGFEAEVSELWFVEEYDVLALALDGKIKVRPFRFGSDGINSTDI